MSAGAGSAPQCDIQQAETGAADFYVLLRAERAAGGFGRIYTLGFTAVDGSGNPTTAESIVTVPHDEGGS